MRWMKEQCSITYNRDGYQTRTLLSRKTICTDHGLLTVHTLLLYSPVGLHLKLAKMAPKDSLKYLPPGLNFVG